MALYQVYHFQIIFFWSISFSLLRVSFAEQFFFFIFEEVRFINHFFHG